MATVLKCEIFIAAFQLMFCPTRSQASAWGYNVNNPDGPSYWYRLYPACAGSYQSPVAFFKDDVIEAPDMAKLDLTSYDEIIPDSKLTILNIGHAIKIQFSEDIEIELRGGDLPGVYKLVQFHFHFGEVNWQGSEHNVGLTAYPMELHLVHERKNKTMESMSGSLGDLAAIAIGFTVANEDNNGIQQIVRQLPDVEYKGKEVKLQKVFQPSQLLPKDYSNFYRYNGSLTTPPCSQSVIWTVLENTIPISEKQLHQFRRVYSTGENASTPIHMRGNFRPIQPLNGRKVLVRKMVDYLPIKKPAEEDCGGSKVLIENLSEIALKLNTKLEEIL